MCDRMCVAVLLRTFVRYGLGARVFNLHTLAAKKLPKNVQHQAADSIQIMNQDVESRGCCK